MVDRIEFGNAEAEFDRPTSERVNKWELRIIMKDSMAMRVR